MVGRDTRKQPRSQYLQTLPADLAGRMALNFMAKTPSAAVLQASGRLHASCTR